jgi:hypothetical protein
VGFKDCTGTAKAKVTSVEKNLNEIENIFVG